MNGYIINIFKFASLYTRTLKQKIFFGFPVFLPIYLIFVKMQSQYSF